MGTARFDPVTMQPTKIATIMRQEHPFLGCCHDQLLLISGFGMPGFPCGQGVVPSLLQARRKGHIHIVIEMESHGGANLTWKA
jgi:hypothetical protein